jgi:hypothetical protein
MQGDAVACGIEEDGAVAVWADGVFGLEHFAAALSDRLLILHRHFPVFPADTILRRCLCEINRPCPHSASFNSATKRDDQRSASGDALVPSLSAATRPTTICANWRAR